MAINKQHDDGLKTDRDMKQPYLKLIQTRDIQFMVATAASGFWNSIFPDNYYISLTNWINNWVVPEKIHTPPTDGILEILAGGGVEGSGNPGGKGGLTLKKSSAGVISTDSWYKSNV